MISKVEILYGLANRCHKYGIKNNISKASLNPLDSILKICDGVDGAEKYDWDLEDLKILRNNIKSINYTKIDIYKFDLNKLLRLVKKHSNIYGKTYLKGIYIHNNIDQKIIEKYNLISSFIREKLKLQIGFSIYSQDDLNFIINNNLSFDMLQIPYNINTRIDINTLRNLKTDIYLRSIFLQGVYFVDLKNKFSDKMVEKIKLQKEVLLQKAHEYNLDLGQYLFSKSISFCKDNGFKGIIIGSSSIERIKSYIINHKFVDTNKDNLDNRFDIISDYLADPRKWKI